MIVKLFDHTYLFVCLLFVQFIQHLFNTHGHMNHMYANTISTTVHYMEPCLWKH